MAKFVQNLTLDFGSGHDVMVCEFKPPESSSAVNADSLSPSLCAPSSSLSLSLKINK